MTSEQLQAKYAKWFAEKVDVVVVAINKTLDELYANENEIKRDTFDDVVREAFIRIALSFGTEQMSDWQPLDIRALELAYGESYFPSDHNQEMQILLRKWEKVVYIFTLDTIVGGYLEVAGGQKVQLDHRPIEQVTLRVRENVEDNK